MKGRGIRLQQERNKKEKMRKVIKNTFGWKLEASKPKVVGLWAHTPHSCSDPTCCGNPRHTIGRKVLTRQEIKSIKKLQEEYQEY